MNITYWAMALLSTTLSEDGFTGYFLSGFIEIPGALLGVMLLFKFGRRTVTVWSFTVQCTGTIQTALAVIAKFFNTFIWVAQPLMLAEMSPTTVRNIFCGTVSFFGVIGAVIAPYLPLLKTISPEAPKVTVSIVSLAAAIVLLTAPETKDLPMPEDVNDFDPGRFLQLFGYQKQRKQSVFMAAENAAIFEEWTTVCLSLLAFLVLKVIIQDVYCFFS
ncbi:unnamed protein product [Acanthocheilonema viteae]|uniref:Major facilitator superfamily (MFS) profile domain-containing protein n=1 Tax=Acanthocheilonema viteae TaxID=6277 RepID=A0A498T088_ACAVI|nr:unnamed protein product [Acanthocheilonema viteae]